MASKIPTHKNLQLPWFPSAIIIQTIGDGSCFFHALALSYCKIYRDGDPNFKRHFIRQLRYQLSLSLAEAPETGGRIRYETLSRGELPTISKNLEQYTLANMQKELNSSSSVDNIYLELCSNIMQKDIYLLDATTKDIYHAGKDSDLLIKERMSIVIIYSPGHYDLVGNQEPTMIRTLFPPTHPFIIAIKSRMK